MAFYGREYSASPVLTLPPQPSHQPSFGVTGFAHHLTPSNSFAAMPVQAPPASLFHGATTAGRKRSRDEASINLEPDAPPESPSDPEEGWTYGPGMVLIKPNIGYVAEASTQSGTWLEEKLSAEEETRRREQEQQRPIIRSHKSLRMAHSDDQLSHPPLPPMGDGSPIGRDLPGTPAMDDQPPVIDDFTFSLGIGWRKISDDEHIQAAARGWARFIENHYPVSDVSIRVESKGLQSYLVEATEGFFLFAENLREGRLVSRNADGAIRNLQVTPPIFDGADTLVAAESPRPVETLQQATLADAEMTMG